MPAPQYSAWQRHLRSFPPLAVTLPQLLATLCVLVTNAHYQLDRPAALFDYAPWLRTPEDAEAERKGALRRHALIVAEAYRRSQDGRTG